MRILYTVFPYFEEARSTVKKLVEEKVISCANMWTIKSLYYFERAFKESDEVAAILKVKVENLDIARTRLRELHSYKTPSIIVIKPESVNNNYLKWVRDISPASSIPAGQQGTQESPQQL